MAAKRGRSRQCPPARLALAALALLAACADERRAVELALPPVTMACEDGRRLWVAFDNEARTANLVVDDLEVELEQVRSASGARYEGEGVLFWTKGADAILETASGATTCHETAASL